MSELSVGQLKGLTINNNVIAIPAGHTLHAPGSVIQVVQSIKSDAAAVGMAAGTGTPTTSNTFFIMSATITPKLVSSKILVFGNIRYTSSGQTPALVLFRDSLPVGIGDTSGSKRRSTTASGLNVDTNQISGHGDLSYLDSPNTLSPVVYSIRAWADNSNTLYINRSVTDADNTVGVRTISTITLMEIAQ